MLLYNDTAPKMHWNKKVSLVGGGSMTYEDLSYTGYTATRKKRSVSAWSGKGVNYVYAIVPDEQGPAWKWRELKVKTGIKF